MSRSKPDRIDPWKLARDLSAHYRSSARRQHDPGHRIIRVYTRKYSDTGQTTCYVEWGDGSRTEGPAYNYHGVLVPVGTHMVAIFDRALREGLIVEREIW